MFETVFVLMMLGLVGFSAFMVGASALVNRKTEKVFVETNSKLDTIHTLVNSNMSAALAAELSATERELAMMHEVIELKRESGRQPTQMTLDALKITEGRIAELRARADDRLQAQA